MTLHHALVHTMNYDASLHTRGCTIVAIGGEEMGDSAAGSRNVEVYEKVEQVGEGTYG